MEETDLLRAKRTLREGGYTCVLQRGDDAVCCTERGVRPLIALLDSGKSFRGYSAADRVVGKAAAYLYVLLGAAAVHAEILSAHSQEVFERFGIPYSCETLVPAIRNRTGTGFCPMETAVREIDDPFDALRALRRKQEDLQNGK